MKKIVMTMMLMSVMLIGFSQQRQLPMSEYYVSPDLYEVMTPAQVEQLRANDPAELIRMNYTMINCIKVANKPVDANSQDMGYLRQFVPEGVQYDENEIIERGFLNPFLWKLPQDENRYNIYKLNRSGWFVVVNPASVMRERIAAHCQMYIINQ